jgi:hypothetical protein
LIAAMFPLRARNRAILPVLWRTPGLAADVLNICGQTVQEYYNRADQIMAAVTFAALMDARRRQSRGGTQPGPAGRVIGRHRPRSSAPALRS